MSPYLLAGTALAALATPLAAQTVVNSKNTQPIRTSALKNGVGDSVKITKDGSIELTSGSALIVDSDHDAANEGKIVVTNSDGASGIEVIGDRQSDITNSGTITVDETYTPTDIDNDKDLDGPFAVGRDRAGIRVRGNLTGNLLHSGTITVEGNQSAGIVIAGTLDGKLVHDGKTGVLGEDSVGVELGAITGDVRLAGTVTAVGKGATAVRLDGDVGGALVVQGDISSTGYRYTAAPTDATKLDADDLLQGGSALVVEGNAAKGIHFAAAPKDTDKADPDEDKDGIEDAKEGSAKIASYGAAPAVVIGSESRDIVIGAVPATGSGFGVIVDGTIAGNGVYAGVNGNGMVIGGRGGAVLVEKGLAVSGSVAATSKDAKATALRFGSGASTGELRNSGNIGATSGNSANSGATAVLIDAGANLPLLRNSGTIQASVGSDGTAAAIIDRSGTLTLVENSGKIIATGAKADTGRNVAIDLSSVTTGAVIKQTAVATGLAAPVIEGDIRFGIGNDLLDLADGSVSGAVTFGAGEDRLTLSGDAKFSGRVDLGGQADTVALSNSSAFAGQVDFGNGLAALTVSDSASFTGKFLRSQNVAVTVSGGSLDLASPTSIASLDVGAKGVIIATLSKDAGAGSAINVSGGASFAEGAKLKLRLTDIAAAEGTYQVLTAGTLTGADKLAGDYTLVPFMYDAKLAVNQAAGFINVDIDRKATKDLGLNGAQSSAYDALYAALADDKKVAGVFLDITEKEAFRAAVAQALPDHAGGAFEGISLGLRSFARTLAQPDGPMDQVGKLRVVFETAGWGSSKDEKDSAHYDLDGFGFSGGVEVQTGLGKVGATGTWLWSRNDSALDNSVLSNTYEGALYWRGDWGAFSGFARGSYGFADFEGSRYFRGTSGGEKLERRIESEWSGNVVSFVGGASAEAGSQYFFVRPSVIIDYVKLSEDGYSETGGGDALDLVIEDRTSDELGLSAAAAVGFDLLGTGRGDRHWARIETEGGWREVLAGELGATTARYGDGEAFIMLPDQRASGWFARLRGLGGDEYYTVSGELSAEERNEEIGFALRASINFGF